MARRYAVAWETPHGEIVVLVCTAAELHQKIVDALADYPEACLQVRAA